MRLPETRYAAQGALAYQALGMGSFDLVYPFFQKPAAWPSTHHIHLCVLGSAQERRHLIFRDYLRSHPSVAAAYVEIKRSLAAAHDGATLESRERYSLAKTQFVTSVIERAIAGGDPRDER